MSHPTRSTTHQEMFFHVFFDSSETARGYKGATVFCRKEGVTWYAMIAYCAASDQFSRRVGRSQARRRYFQMWDMGVKIRLDSEKPTYDMARVIALDFSRK